MKTEEFEALGNVVNNVFDTPDGQKFLLYLMEYCRYWTPTFILIKQGFKPEEIVAYNNVVKNCIFSHLDPERMAVLIKKAKTKGEN